MFKPLKLLVEIFIRDKNEHRHYTPDGGFFIAREDEQGVSFVSNLSPQIKEAHFLGPITIHELDLSIFENPEYNKMCRRFGEWKRRSEARKKNALDRDK